MSRHRCSPAARPSQPGSIYAAGSLDHCLWIALLAGKPDSAQVEATRAELGGGSSNRRRVLNIGVAPAMAIPTLFEDVGIRARVPHVWEVSTPHGDGEDYLPVDVIADGTCRPDPCRRLAAVAAGRRRHGRADERRAAAVPRRRRRSAAAHRRRRRGGATGHVDSPAARRGRACSPACGSPGPASTRSRSSSAARSAARPSGTAPALPISSCRWARPRSSPTAWRSKSRKTKACGRGAQVADVAAAGRDERVFSLDSEAGTVRFGDGVRGRAPEAGRVVQVARMRAGGGAAGNLPAGVIKTISAPTGAPRLKVLQPLPTTGGADAENLADAEARIPAHDPPRRPRRDGRRLSRVGAAHARRFHRPRRSAGALQAAAAPRRRARRRLRDGAAGAPGHRRTRAATRSSVARDRVSLGSTSAGR